MRSVFCFVLFLLFPGSDLDLYLKRPSSPIKHVIPSCSGQACPHLALAESEQWRDT